MSKRTLTHILPALLVGVVASQAISDQSRADSGEDPSTSAPRLGAYSSGRAGDEPPGHDGRITHQTLLQTRELDCHEISIARAGSIAELRSRVPAHYTLGAARLFINDYACRNVSADAQTLSKETIISLGHVPVTHRDGQPVSGSSYLLWLATDNPALAARYRQVGVAATFAPGSSWSISTAATGEVTTSIVLEAPDIAHRLTTVAPLAPTPQPPTQASGLTLYHQGWNGEVRLDYRNTEIAAVSAKVAGDLSTAPDVAQLVANPALLKLSGSSTFSNAAIHGSWTGTLQRIE